MMMSYIIIWTNSALYLAISNYGNFYTGKGVGDTILLKIHFYGVLIHNSHDGRKRKVEQIESKLKAKSITHERD